jgi:hypothetical protein
MIAAVKGWHAVFTALLFILPPGAPAADDLNGAARELARKTAAFTGRGETVTLVWRDVSALGSSGSVQARGVFEAALGDAGIRIGELVPAAELRVTLSENASQYLLVEEVRRGEDRQVWIAGWKKTEPASAAAPGVVLERKLVWEQDEQILDVAFPGAGMLALSPSKVTLYERQNGGWQPRQAVPVASAKPWPRDLRGHLRLTGAAFQAYLPGMTCSGATEPALAMECRAGDDQWILESGSRGMLLASYNTARNYFDGRVVTQAGARKTVPSFYSAASVEEQGRPLWLLALVDGRTQIFDASFEPVGNVTSWGSDIAGVEGRCSGGAQVLTTRPGDASEPDAIQAFAIVNRAAVPLAEPAAFPGPVTALWSSGATSALAVVRDLTTGRYGAYVVTLVCGGPGAG